MLGFIAGCFIMHGCGVSTHSIWLHYFWFTEQWRHWKQDPRKGFAYLSTGQTLALNDVICKHDKYWHDRKDKNLPPSPIKPFFMPSFSALHGYGPSSIGPWINNGIFYWYLFSSSKRSLCQAKGSSTALCMLDRDFYDSSVNIQTYRFAGCYISGLL